MYAMQSCVRVSVRVNGVDVAMTAAVATFVCRMPQEPHTVACVHCVCLCWGLYDVSNCQMQNAMNWFRVASKRIKMKHIRGNKIRYTITKQQVHALVLRFTVINQFTDGMRPSPQRTITPTQQQPEPHVWCVARQTHNLSQIIQLAFVSWCETLAPSSIDSKIHKLTELHSAYILSGGCGVEETQQFRQLRPSPAKNHTEKHTQ